MTINIKLSDRRAVRPDQDPMGRDWVGYEPTLTDAEVFEQNRGMWYLAERAAHEGYATFSYKGEVVAVAAIAGIETMPWPKPDGRKDKQALVGRPLGPGDRAYEHFIGRVIDGSSRNPVAYIDDPDPRPEPEPSFCACGCGAVIDASKHFAPGHDQKAVRERISRRWGSTLSFVRWFDSTDDTAERHAS